MFVMKSSTKITYKNGFFFPLGGQIFACVLILIAFFALLNHVDIVQICVGITMLTGGIALLSTQGIDIDTNKQMLRPYNKVVGIKIGKKIPLGNFKLITVIQQSYTQNTFSKTS